MLAMGISRQIAGSWAAESRSMRVFALHERGHRTPGEVVERVELPLPSTPVELIGPEGDEALQPVQLRALLPAYVGNLVGPSRMAQPGS